MNKDIYTKSQNSSEKKYHSPEYNPKSILDELYLKLQTLFGPALKFSNKVLLEPLTRFPTAEAARKELWNSKQL